MLAERAVEAPNLHPHPMFVPPTPPELVDTLKSAKQLDVHVGPPDANLHVWISPAEPAQISVNVKVTRDKADFHIERKAATQPAVLSAPSGACIVLLHGIQDHQESGPYLLYKELLTAAGYQVVQVDLRGHGRSTGQWITYGVVESRDLVQMLDELDRQKLVNGPVGVFGVSYGAAVAIQWAAIDPRVKAVVALEPFATFRDAAHDAAPLVLGNFKWLFTAKDIDRAVELAGQMAGFDPNQASPLAAIARTQAPVLLIHSKDDELVSYGNSERLHAADPVFSGLITVTGQSHFWMWLQSLNKIQSATLTWFRVHLSPEASVARNN